MKGCGFKETRGIALNILWLDFCEEKTFAITDWGAAERGRFFFRTNNLKRRGTKRGIVCPKGYCVPRRGTVYPKGYCVPEGVLCAPKGYCVPEGVLCAPKGYCVPEGVLVCPEGVSCAPKGYRVPRRGISSKCRGKCGK